jgi:hypothetical protein
MSVENAEMAFGSGLQPKPDNTEGKKAEVTKTFNHHKG